MKVSIFSELFLTTLWYSSLLEQPQRLLSKIIKNYQTRTVWYVIRLLPKLGEKNDNCPTTVLSNFIKSYQTRNDWILTSNI